MMTKTVKNYATANIFGPYILRMKRQLFQVIDDYVEQA